MPADLLLDVTRLAWRAWHGRLPTGIDRVCLAYMERLGHRARALVQQGPWRRVLTHSQSQDLFHLLLRGPSLPRADLLKALWRPLLAGGDPLGAGVRSLYLSHTGVESPGFADWVLRTRQRAVYFAHDLIPLTHPEYCRPGIDDEHERRIAAMLQTGTAVIVNSGSTLADLKAFAQSRLLNLPPTLVAPLAPGPALSLQVPASSPLQHPFFVVVGTIEARNNHLLLLQVWRDLATQMGDAVPHLVIIGRRGWECESALDMLERCPALKGCVHELGARDDAQLRSYLQHARALLFPSFVEGFGLPLVEALASRVPVIASDLPVFREVAGDVPDYLSPLDGPAWASAVLDYSAEPSPRCEAQRLRMAPYIAPTWDGHFDLVEQFLGLA